MVDLAQIKAGLAWWYRKTDVEFFYKFGVTAGATFLGC